MSSSIRILILAYLCSISYHHIVAQQGFAPLLWEVPEPQDQGYHPSSINFNPGWLLDREVDLVFDIQGIRCQNVFVVYDSESLSQIGQMTSAVATYGIDDYLRDAPDLQSPTFVNIQALLEPDTLRPAEELLRINGLPDDQEVFFEGQIAELIVFERSISDSLRRSVESYLSIKYGISLPPDSTYLDDLYTIIKLPLTGYKSRVTAIGRNDYYRLAQYRSTNSDDQSNIVVSAPAEVFADRNYMFWSDNGAALTMEVEEHGAMVSAREWTFYSEALQSGSAELDVTVDPSTISGYTEELEPWMLVSHEPIDRGNLTDCTWLPVTDRDHGLVAVVPIIAGHRLYSRLVLAPKEGRRASSFVTVDCVDGTPRLHLDPSAAGYDYSLIREGDEAETLRVVGEDVSSAGILLPGVYRVTRAQGAVDADATRLVVKQDHCTTHTIDLYPNPLSVGKLCVVESTLLRPGTRVMVHDVFGRVVYDDEHLEDQGQHYITLGAAGTYQVHVMDQEKTLTKPLIVVR